MKLLIYPLLLSSLLLAASCSQKLDDLVPDTRISFDNLSSSNLPLVINGAKLSFMNNNSLYLFYSYQDVMSDDITSLTFPTWEGNNVSPLDNGLTYIFKQPYATIATVNMVIRYEQEHAGDSTIRGAAGEAYLLRAYAYNWLSDHFGGVPLVYGNEDPRQRATRNTLAEVRQQMEKDYQKAITLLPDYTNATIGSKQAAQLLLARLYLNTGRNEEALTLANTVISSGKLSLTSNFGDIFKSGVNSPEALYKLNETPAPTTDKYGLPNWLGPGAAAGANIAGNGNNWIDSAIVKSYESTDIRRPFFTKVKGAGITEQVYFLTKFPQESVNSYPICRYSEAFLIAAEATARKGTVDVTAYNQLRSARKASIKNNTDFANAAAFLVDIEAERRREFVGEHQRWQDMERFGKREAWIKSYGVPSSHALLPLPSREFSINPYLEQNPDYSK
ncbi:Starch-binding associating with outer membrane [Chitinophaga jiangningensis]|uniref:Starch-binding associating with outer membrane n=1 Tax=Chitinophaga jiangningensis TaxID=1419482 RepID=A0A1M6ZTN1_9BACT|nr:RagB/SusD family nutrient uptake outer membrane protein [Chitinophaga jiangningensis]SHL33705.1 Starch-binding associating with outer membrane [Chitinophaga jiangningensis]